MPCLIHKGKLFPLHKTIKPHVLFSGSSITITPYTSTTAIYAIYAAKLTKQIGVYPAWEYAKKRGVDIKVFTLAVMCELTSPLSTAPIVSTISPSN